MIQRSAFFISTRGPLLVAMAITWIAGIFLYSLLPSLLSPPFLLIATIGILLALLLLHPDIQSRTVLLLIACLLLGAWRYAIAFPANDPQSITTFIGQKNITVRGFVVDEPKFQGHTRTLLIDVTAIQLTNNGSWQEAHGRLEAFTSGIAIESLYSANYGDTITLHGTLQASPSIHPADVFTSITFPLINILNKGNTPLAYLYHFRVQCATLLAQLLPQPQAALLVALLLSLHTPALDILSHGVSITHDLTVTQAFSVTGTAHLIAPSGFKVTIIAGLVKASTIRLYEGKHSRKRFLLPAQRRRNWRIWISTGLAILTIVLYTALCGFVPAAVRAGLMGSMLLIAPLIGRRYNVYAALAFVAILLSALDPFVLWDVGFLLSFLGTLGIVLLTPFLQRPLHPLARLPIVGHYLTETTAVTLAAQVATLPIVAIVFGNISFVAVLTNILTILLLGILLIAGFLLCLVAFCSLPVALIGSLAIKPLLDYTLFIVNWCANLRGAYINTPPGFNVAIAWAYYGGLLLLLISMRKLLFPEVQATHTTQAQQSTAPFPQSTTSNPYILQGGIALLFVLAIGTNLLAAPTTAQLTITFLAVGPAGQPRQGEAILIRTPDHKTTLIDGGLDAASLAQELDSRLPPWQRSLDYVFLTTPRPDDIGGLQDVVTRYQIGVVLDAGMLHPNVAYASWRHVIAQRSIPYRAVSTGTSIALGAQVVLQVLWPAQLLHKGGDEERNNALILRLVAPGLSLLFLGAAAQSSYALSTVRSSIDPNYFHVQIVHMVGAVGKQFPTDLTDILQLARPAYIVVTPAALSTKQRHIAGIATQLPITGALANTDWQVFQTAKVGSVEVSSNGIHWSISPVELP